MYVEAKILSTEHSITIYWDRSFLDKDIDLEIILYDVYNYGGYG